jgi:flagellar hook-associated protein 2
MTISPINLGSTFTNTSGSTVLNGLSSGLDTQAVISSIVAAQSAQIAPLQDQVTLNNSQASALTQLQNLLTALQTAASPLSNPNSPDSTNNLWAVNTSSITGNTSQAASNYLTASVASGTASGTYTISNITQIATDTTQETQAFTVDPSTTSVVVASGASSGQFNAGTFTIQGPSSTGSVTFNAGDTLDDIAADFNAASSTTGLTAAVTTTSTGVYALSFTNTTTGAPVTFDLTSSANITSDPSGVFNAQTSSTFTLSAATNPFVVSSGATSGQFNAGTITLTGPSVTLKTGDTLAKVAADFNAVESTTGISATVLQTSPGTYNMVFSSTTTGAATLFDFTNTAKTGTVSESDGNNVLGNITFQTMTSGAEGNEGQDASFELNGTPITRPTNAISDLITGVTLNLLATAPSNSFTLQILPDTTSIAQGISAFATAYNNFLSFYATQTQLNSSGTPTSAAVLYSDTTLQNIYNQVTTEAASLVSGLTKGQPNTLASVGVDFTNQPATSTTPAVSNILSVDTATLESELSSNFTGVENVFGYNLTSSSPNLILYQSSTQQTVNDFSITINDTDPSNPVYTAHYTDSNNDPQSVVLTSSSAGSGVTLLTGPSGSVFSGLQLIYTGDGSDSPITVTTTQGIAAQLNSIATTAIAPTTGLIADDQAAIATKTTSINTQITNITNQISTQRTELLSKFAALESAISQANSSLDLLNAQQLAGSSSGG